jgi:hypothetical protein
MASFTNEVQASAYNSKSHLASSIGVKGKKRKVVGNLISQQLTSRLDDTNKKGVALLQVYNPSRQTRHFILEYGYLFHKTASSAGFIHCHLRLVFRQRQAALKV